MKISHLSTEYLHVAVTDEINASDPTADPVSFAFVEVGEEPSSWVTGSWDPDSSDYFARVLIGPDGESLEVGTYDVWIRMTDTPEVVIRKVGRLTVT